ncbi:putative GTPase activating protein (Evi5) [Aspergillus ibericus CBS 121593]|uniref:GTPase activating protein n=1 Tax=Aspergillus ibericus CBS 121593 TaxID=1448316 RepID=A0A395HCG6_9EURO|nr:GTPase activating protein [Aspergillus ibericus CBS 121593]RAL03924.1 GTPase activating protein [Aspergillus ibericus CBS 121593]
MAMDGADRTPSHVHSDSVNTGSHDTDSMVTVPLTSNSEHTQPDWRTLDIPQTPVDVTSPTRELSSDGENDPKTTPTQEPPRADLAPSSICGDASSIRSRSSAERDRKDDAVDWEELEKTEEQEPRCEGSDESTALLLARLEQENNALATNPKSALASKSHAQRITRPSRSQSLHQIKRLIDEDPRSSLRYSQLPPPPMTELEFWAALVADYPQTAQRLPTLTSNKIRSGVPPPLRGVVWPSLAGARDNTLLAEYQRLCGETSPYEGLIGKDIGRSFPNVEMFRDPNGEGQQMLGRVLKCFSLYDTKIGYCQGLGFVVGPLLMHMTDAEAFCVLVRLMDHYDLRTCYLPDLSGLHLRVYQFQNLLARLRPGLFAHLEALNVEPVYVSQWFLSFFAVACPLPMLLRIYDVIFLEGACETLMRVALSLMTRNEKKIMACAEFEDVMQLLLSRSLWDTYACHADEFVNDFVSLTSLVTKESLQALEASYNQSQGVPTGISFPQMQAAASRFLGRLWAGSNSHNSVKSISLNPNSATAASIRRSASKQSMTSTLNSVESASDASTAPTELSTDAPKPRAKSAISQHKDRDLHTQIEELLIALSDLQRQHADLTRELQQEREEREEDQTLAKSMLQYIKETAEEPPMELVHKADARFAMIEAPKNVTMNQTKHQLRDDLNRYKEMHALESSRCKGLTRRIDEHEKENSSLREQLREARGRIQDSYRERQRLERMVRELRTVKTKTRNSDTAPSETYGSPTSDTSEGYTSTGLRELKLVRTNSQKSQKSTTTPTTFNKRSSSLGLQSVLATENNKPAAEDALLLELVNAKTAEAVARQELEEVKGKMDSMRKIMSRHGIIPEGRHSFLGRPPSVAKAATEPAPNGGGLFSGWGRRAVSTSNESYDGR